MKAVSLTERIREETKQAVGWNGTRPTTMTYREIGKEIGLHHTVVLHFLHGRAMSGPNLDKIVAWMSSRR